MNKSDLKNNMIVVLFNNSKGIIVKNEKEEYIQFLDKEFNKDGYLELSQYNDNLYFIDEDDSDFRGFDIVEIYELNNIYKR